MSQRHYDPFPVPMSAGTEKKTRKKRRWLRWLLACVALVLALLLASFGSVCLYMWLTGRQVDLTGREVTFPQLRADRENALSVPEIYAHCRPWVVSLDLSAPGSPNGFGTGFVLSSDGYILTCAHVIDEPNATIRATLSDGTVYDAQVVASDRQTDVGVLKIAALGLDAAQLGNSGQVVVGEQAITIGNPLGARFAASLTAGWISARERTVTIDNYMMTLFQFDAAVSPGNSGGPLFNSLGQVIGVVNAKVTEDKVEGIGFAIPIDLAVEVAEDLIQYGFVQQRPWLGVTVQESSGPPSHTLGVQVVDITPGSAAEAAGLQIGDWIVAFNGATTRTVAILNYAKDQCAVGDTVLMVVMRDGMMLDLPCTLQAMPSAVE